jgi:uncharacterized OB-fold protein
MTSPKPHAREDAVNSPFFDGLRAGTLLLQHCHECQAVMDYPRLACTQCLSTNLALRISPGRGTIHSFTIVHRHYDEAFHDELPFVVLLVDLAEGVRILTGLAGRVPDAVSIAIGAEVLVEPFVDAAGRALHRARLT